MNPASLMLRARRALLIGLVLAASACEAKDSAPILTDLPATLFGTWQVSDVRIDRGDTRPWGYKSNVHKYLGRIFVFTPERLTYNTPWWKESKQVCEAPKVAVRRAPALRIVKTSLCTRPFQPVQPRPTDFGLPLADDVSVEVLSLFCRNELMSSGMGGNCRLEPQPADLRDEIKGAWLIALNPDELALRWHEEVFLILKRLPKDAKPRASFDCARAATETERAICGSVSLAAFDVSVAGSYKHALDYYNYALRTYDPRIKDQTQKQLAAFKQSQKDWLKKRDGLRGR
ncbi:MAG: hypothetical protein MZV65_37780 [Chromatiales bacterium]|nr:hypothetical protein [Chromatiales bacterium]